MGGTGPRWPYTQALERAQEVYALLRPVCTRIQIAGSIRRQREDIGDIELVVIPGHVTGGLFDDAPEVDPAFCAVINQWPAVRGKPTGKHTQRLLPCGMKLDVFMVNADTWGLQLAVRTGSAAFSEQVLARTWVQQGYHSKDGLLRRNGEIIAIREEVDLFVLLKLPWVEPWAREV